MAEYHIAALSTLIEQFNRLPGIGHKTATRLAYYVLSMPEEEAAKLSGAITEAHQKIHYCKVCGNFTDKEVCSICTDQTRDRSIICVVESPRDLLAMERMDSNRVLYHVLGGVISPLNGVLPDMLRIKELLQRLNDGTVKEILMATNATVEGEATAMYISKLIKPLGIRVTRIAFGIPVGGDIEYADEETLSLSIEGRRDI